MPPSFSRFMVTKGSQTRWSWTTIQTTLKLDKPTNSWYGSRASDKSGWGRFSMVLASVLYRKSAACSPYLCGFSEMEVNSFSLLVMKMISSVVNVACLLQTGPQLLFQDAQVVMASKSQCDKVKQIVVTCSPSHFALFCPFRLCHLNGHQLFTGVSIVLFGDLHFSFLDMTLHECLGLSIHWV